MRLRRERQRKITRPSQVPKGGRGEEAEGGELQGCLWVLLFLVPAQLMVFQAE